MVRIVCYYNYPSMAYSGKVLLRSYFIAPWATGQSMASRAYGEKTLQNTDTTDGH
jgi:hypothetical protein